MNYDHNYYEKGLAKFFKDGAECFWHSWIKRRILVVDIIAEHSNVQNKDYYRRVEYWTDTPAAVLHENGYRICEGLHDNLAWIGVPIMMKLYNFKTIIVDDPKFSKDTPSTLNDRMNSNLLNKFAKSLARAAALNGMDLQKLMLMGIVGVGAIIGMKMLGVF